MTVLQRRPIYTDSLEAYIDVLHAKLLEAGLYPVQLEAVDAWAGLNSAVAKVRFLTFSSRLC